MQLVVSIPRFLYSALVIFDSYCVMKKGHEALIIVRAVMIDEIGVKFALARVLVSLKLFF